MLRFDGDDQLLSCSLAGQATLREKPCRALRWDVARALVSVAEFAEAGRCAAFVSRDEVVIGGPGYLMLGSLRPAASETQPQPLTPVAAISATTGWRALATGIDIELRAEQATKRLTLAHRRRIHALEFIGSRPRLVSAAGDALRIWDVETATAVCQQRITGDRPIIAVGHDGLSFAFTSSDTRVVVFAPPSFEPQDIPVQLAEPITAMTWLDETTLAVATGQTFSFLDVRSGEVEDAATAHRGSIRALIGSEWRTLLSCAGDGTCELWDTRKRRRIAIHASDDPVERAWKIGVYGALLAARNRLHWWRWGDGEPSAWMPTRQTPACAGIQGRLVLLLLQQNGDVERYNLSSLLERSAHGSTEWNAG
jgi:WD40 repeat protein